MIFEWKDIKLGDTVLYLDKRPFGYGGNASYLPAIVEQIYPVKAGEEFPDLGLMVIVNGFHMPSVGYPRRPHGTKAEQWLTRDEAKAFYTKQQADIAAEKAKVAVASEAELVRQQQVADGKEPEKAVEEPKKEKAAKA